ncbi:Uncharacterised protein [Burkholderia pseudomallei]|nr:Uncharacterised protein [Burkholderia pseudomallei]
MLCAMVHKGLRCSGSRRVEANLREHPQGVENGYGPWLWTAQAIHDETDDRELAGKGVCIIEAIDDTRHILLRARTRARRQDIHR